MYLYRIYALYSCSHVMQDVMVPSLAAPSKTINQKAFYKMNMSEEARKCCKLKSWFLLCTKDATDRPRWGAQLEEGVFLSGERLVLFVQEQAGGALQMGTQTYPDNCSHSCWAQSPPYNRTRTCRRAAHSRAVHKDCPARIVLQRQRKEETKKLGVSFYCVSFMFHENVLLNILPNDPDNWSSVIELHGQCCCTGGIECNRLSTRIS